MEPPWISTKSIGIMAWNLADVLDRVMREKCKGMFTSYRDVMFSKDFNLVILDMTYIYKIEHYTVYTIYLCPDVYMYIYVCMIHVSGL